LFVIWTTRIARKMECFMKKISYMFYVY
jgi:hypothetical protein